MDDLRHKDFSQEAASGVNQRLWLYNLYQEKRRRRPGYSLRAFAKSVGVSHATICQVINGNRPLSRKTAQKVIDRLNLPPEARQQILSSFVDKGTDTHRYQMLEVEQFKLISEWHHYAILSLLEVPGARTEPAWIAERLNITVADARAALERLIDLGLIEQNRQGAWRQSGRPLTTTTDISSPAIREFTSGALQLAEASLERDSVEERDFSTITMATSERKLEEAKLRIKAFRRSLCSFLESDDKERVYMLAIQLFPLDTKVSKGVSRD